MLTYSGLRRYTSFIDRFEYLKLHGVVGQDTFGFDRYMNQQFYRSTEWKRVRQQVIARDLGCDLGVEGHEIADKVIIHHMQPLTPKDIVHGSDDMLDPEFLISVTHRTHNAIHFGDASLLAKPYVPRRAGDTQLWSRSRL
jgi:hypothetical protein